MRIRYGLVFGLCFATLAPHYLFQGQGEGASVGELPRMVGQIFGDTLGPPIAKGMVEGSYVLRRLSPLPVIMHLVGQGSVGSQGLLQSNSGATEFFICSSMFTLALVVAALAQLNHRMFDRSRAQGKITDDQSLSVRSFRRLLFLVDPPRRTTGIPFYLNPDMVKEFRTRRSAWPPAAEGCPQSRAAPARAA